MSLPCGNPRRHRVVPVRLNGHPGFDGGRRMGLRPGGPCPRRANAPRASAAAQQASSASSAATFTASSARSRSASARSRSASARSRSASARSCSASASVGQSLAPASSSATRRGRRPSPPATRTGPRCRPARRPHTPGGSARARRAATPGARAGRRGCGAQGSGRRAKPTSRSRRTCPARSRSPCGRCFADELHRHERRAHPGLPGAQRDVALVRRRPRDDEVDIRSTPTAGARRPQQTRGCSRSPRPQPVRVMRFANTDASVVERSRWSGDSRHVVLVHQHPRPRRRGSRRTGSAPSPSSIPPSPPSPRRRAACVRRGDIRGLPGWRRGGDGGGSGGATVAARHPNAARARPPARSPRGP